MKYKIPEFIICDLREKNVNMNPEQNDWKVWINLTRIFLF